MLRVNYATYYIGAGEVKFTCGGCQSEENAPEFYCRGISWYLYFRCEGNDSSSLVWDIPSVLETPVTLGALTPEDNIIPRGDITVAVDTVDFTEDRRQIVSYLWLDIGMLESDVSASCMSNGDLRMKSLKLLGRINLFLP